MSSPSSLEQLSQVTLRQLQAWSSPPPHCCSPQRNCPASRQQVLQQAWRPPSAFPPPPHCCFPLMSSRFSWQQTFSLVWEQFWSLASFPPHHCYSPLTNCLPSWMRR